jgi:hypothetical protein
MNVTELSYLIFAVLASTCAGYGAIALTWRIIGGFEGKFTPLLGLVVGVGAVALMIRSILIIRSERIRKFFSPRA